jgi:CubicO group peptidase (beta-lactamase class C family)
MISPLPTGPLSGYPTEQSGSWPRHEWPGDSCSPQVQAIFDEAFNDPALSETRAALLIHRGQLLAERYAGSLPSFVDAPREVGAEVPLLSWSMAKSVLALLVAQLVDDGLLALEDPLEVPEWGSDDPRRSITLNHALEMRDGLAFAEEYTDDGVSDVIEMLFGAGASDVAAYAASRPLAHQPGEVFNYSSGTSNLIARQVGLRLGGEAAVRAALTDRIFAPLAITSADPGFDDAGTFMASSYLHATARDFARLGLMLCRGGRAQGQQIVPEAWVDRWRTPCSEDPEGYLYSAHFWAFGDEWGTFYLAGFEGQSTTICPPLDLVIVRLGTTPAERNEHLFEWRQRLIAQVAAELPS